ncbi:MAG: hypothetical protein WB678_19685, partial [Stellaceae bacterium]
MPEPSMEEIIASISRIIAEDNRSADARSADALRAPADRGGVLELTEAIAADGSVRRLAPLGASSPGPSSPGMGTGREPASASPA